MTFMTLLRIAWRNLGRNRKRTGLALAAIATSQFALLSMNGVMRGYRDGAVASITGPLVGDVQVHIPGWLEDRAVDSTIPEVTKTLKTLSSQEGVKRAVARIYAPALAAVSDEGHAVLVLGLEREEESRVGGLLEAVSAETPFGEKQVLVGANLAQEMGMTVGTKLALVGQGADGSIANDLYTVSGLVTTASEAINRGGLLMALGDAQQLLAMPDQAHELVAYARSSDQANALAEQLRGLSALGGLDVQPWTQVVPGLVAFFELTKMAGLIVLVLVFLSSAAGIANTLMMATFERVHEFGMLLALGSSPRTIVKMVFVETVMLGLLGVAIGTVLGLGLVAVTAKTGVNLGWLGGQSNVNLSGLRVSLIVTPRLEVLDVLRGVGAVLLTSVVVALLPAYHASRLEPMEALRA